MKKIIISIGSLLIAGSFQVSQAQSTVAVAGGEDCSNAADISSYVGDAGDERFTSIKGDNFNPGTVGNDLQPDVSNDGCWVGANAVADHSVWYKFQADSGKTYTVSTNLGTNALDEDTQLAIWSACSGGNLIACNDDAEDNCDDGNLAAATSFTASSSGFVYVQVDLFGTTQGHFTLSAIEVGSPANDHPDDAIDINTAYGNLSSSYITEDAWFLYGAPVFNSVGSSLNLNDSLTALYAPDHNEIAGDPGDCANPAISEVFDVWFELAYDSDNPALLSAFNQRGDVFLGIQAYTRNGDSVSFNAGGEIDNLNLEGCSLGDGLGFNGGSEDWAVGDFTNHPRLNLDELNLADGTTILIRVYQYTRVLVGDTNTVAPPCYGFIKLAFEQYTETCLGPDGQGQEDLDCKDASAFTLTPASVAGKDTVLVFNGLNNAGARGGISAIQGGTALPTGRAGEPGDWIVPGGSTIEYENCDPDEGTVFVDPQEYFNNNSRIFPFNVIEETRAVNTADTLLSVTLNDSIFTFVNPADSTDTIVVPDQEISATIRLCRDVVAVTGAPPTDLFVASPINCDSIVTTCGADVEFRFNNLNYCGVNGNTFEAFVVPFDQSTGFGSPVASYFGGSPDDACDDCWSMRSFNFYLPEGEYCLVIDGEAGNLVEFDLEMDIKYLVPGTNISCDGGQQVSPLRMAGTNLFDQGVRPLQVSPNPAANFANVSFEVPQAGEVVYYLYDLSGKMVQKGTYKAQEGENLLRLDLQGSQSGLQVLHMYYNDTETTIKLMRE